MSRRRKVGGGGCKRWKRRTVNVRGRIKKAGCMHANGKEVAVRQDDRET